MSAPGMTRRYAATNVVADRCTGHPGSGMDLFTWAPVRAMPRQTAARCASGLVHQPELAQQAEFVEAPPALHDAAVTDAPDVDPGKGDVMAGRWHAENFALLRAAGGEVFFLMIPRPPKYTLFPYTTLFR